MLPVCLFTSSRNLMDDGSMMYVAGMYVTEFECVLCTKHKPEEK